jgi:hypothetical protein
VLNDWWRILSIFLSFLILAQLRCLGFTGYVIPAIANYDLNLADDEFVADKGRSDEGGQQLVPPIHPNVRESPSVYFGDRRADAHVAREESVRKAPTLRFDVCGGLTNQRVAIIEGLVVAQLTQRAVVLPALNRDGTQTGPLYKESKRELVPFATFFDVGQTSEALTSLGVQIEGAHLATPEAREDDTSTALSVQGRQYSPAWYAAQPMRDLRLGCTFLALDVSNNSTLEQLYWRVDNALTFASPIASAASRIVAHLHVRSLALGGGGAFTALHFRNEPDWIEHCERWQAKSPLTQARQGCAQPPQIRNCHA